MIRNAREENSRRGGWVRIFPTAETWSTYGSMLEFSSPNNQILHEHLFPETTKKHSLRPPNYRKNPPKNPVKAPPNIQSGNSNNNVTEYRKRSQSAGPGREKVPHETDTNAHESNTGKPKPEPELSSGELESLPCPASEMNRPRTSSGAVISSSSSSSGIGSMTSSEDDITSEIPISPPNPTCK